MPDALELPTRTRLRVRIHGMRMLGEWYWSYGKGERCGVCQLQFETSCPDCVAPGDGCPVVAGACKHAFHLHCIDKWTNAQSQTPACPLCRAEWKFAE